MHERGTIRVVLTMKSDCWVSAMADSRPVVERLLRAGESVELTAMQSIVFKAGDAAADHHADQRRDGPQPRPCRTGHHDPDRSVERPRLPRDALTAPARYSHASPRMDPGIRSPLVDFFRRGDVARDVRLQAAQGALAPRAIDQLALLLVLLDDGDPEVARSASATIDRLPQGPLSGFLASPEVSSEMRAFFAARGIEPSGEAPQTDEPLIDDGQEEVAEGPPNEDELSTSRRLAQMNVMQRIKVAMRGRREERSILIRDPNRLVSVAVLSSPKVTDAEVESFAKMANVSEEVLRVIGMNRQWTKNYGVVAGLVRNPKTPVAISLTLLQRVNDKDVRMLATDRNIPEPIRIAARKRATASRT